MWKKSIFSLHCCSATLLVWKHHPNSQAPCSSSTPQIPSKKHSLWSYSSLFTWAHLWWMGYLKWLVLLCVFLCFSLWPPRASCTFQLFPDHFYKCSAETILTETSRKLFSFLIHTYICNVSQLFVPYWFCAVTLKTPHLPRINPIFQCFTTAI